MSLIHKGVLMGLTEEAKRRKIAFSDRTTHNNNVERKYISNVLRKDSNSDYSQIDYLFVYVLGGCLLQIYIKEAEAMGRKFPLLV